MRLMSKEKYVRCRGRSNKGLLGVKTSVKHNDERTEEKMRRAPISEGEKTED